MALDNSELVARKAIGDLAVAKSAADALRRHLEHGVAGAVAERVVDRLEVVEVDLHQCQLFARRRQDALQVVAELPAIGQARQHIVRRLVEKQRPFAFAMAADLAARRAATRFEHANAAQGAEDQKRAPGFGGCVDDFDAAGHTVRDHGLDRRLGGGSKQFGIEMPQRRIDQSADFVGFLERRRSARQMEGLVIEREDFIGVGRARILH
ncbi:hypothetical protein D9M72_408860 [compost metagenome]